MVGKQAGEARSRILVVEDDPTISLGLRINLEAEGYVVTTADDGDKALAAVAEGGFDLVVLDVMLPARNGFEVLSALRKDGHLMPIIMLSARTSEMDKVTGLELGAEDYVAKPFSLAELLARIKAALRRAAMGKAKASNHAFGEVVIDVEAHSVTRGGEEVELTSTELEVLLFFVQSRGRALTREEIFRHVWGANHHGTVRTIDNFVQQLRSKLEVDPQNPRHFQTVRGTGYRFSP